MKRRRLLAWLMTAIMAATSVPGNVFTARASEEMDAALVSMEEMPGSYEEAYLPEAEDPVVSEIGDEDLPVLTEETEEAEISVEGAESSLVDAVLFPQNELLADDAFAADENIAEDAEFQDEALESDQDSELSFNLPEEEDLLTDGFFIEEELEEEAASDSFDTEDVLPDDSFADLIPEEEIASEVDSALLLGADEGGVETGAEEEAVQDEFLPVEVGVPYLFDYPADHFVRYFRFTVEQDGVYDIGISVPNGSFELSYQLIHAGNGNSSGSTRYTYGGEDEECSLFSAWPLKAGNTYMLHITAQLMETDGTDGGTASLLVMPNAEYAQTEMTVDVPAEITRNVYYLFQPEENGEYVIDIDSQDGVDWGRVTVYTGTDGFSESTEIEPNQFITTDSFYLTAGETALIDLYFNGSDAVLTGTMTVRKENDWEPVTFTLDPGEYGYFTRSEYDPQMGSWVEKEVSLGSYSCLKGDYVDRGALPEPQPREGYLFAGWSLEENAAEPMEQLWDDSYGEYYFTAEEDMTLYAVWTETITITFNAGAHGYFPDQQYNEETGDWEEIESFSRQSVYPKGDYIGNWSGPSLNSREGYIFNGWSLEPDATEPMEEFYEDGVGNYLFTAEEDVTLYAVWAEEVTITYSAGSHGHFTEWQYDENGNGTIVPVQERKSSWARGTYVGASYETKADNGYVFAGWSWSEDGSQPVEWMNDEEHGSYYLIAEEDVTLYAVYAEEVKITWEIGEGGYFKEWRYDEETGDSIEEEVSSTVTSYRKGDYVGWMSYYEREGKYFLGWSTDPDATEPMEWQSAEGYGDYLFIAEADVTLYGVWTDAVTFTLHGNGGTFRVWDDEIGEEVPSESSFSKVRKGEKLGGFGQPEAPEGKTFLGWSTDPDVTEPMPWIEEEDGSSYLLIAKEDMDLYAVWETYPVIIWDANGGYFYGDPEETRIRQSWINFDDLDSQWNSGPDNADETLVFAGWTDIEGGTEPIEDYYEYFSEKSDIILYAIWEEGIPVTWDANGGYFGEEDDSSQTMITYVRAGTDSFWSPDGYVRSGEEGMMLQRWSTTADGQGESWPIVEEPLTMYAVWAKECTITLDAGDGSFIHWIYDRETGDEYSVEEQTMTFTRAAGTKLWEWEVDEALGDYGLRGPEDMALIGWEPSGSEWIGDEDRYCLVESDMTFAANWGSYYTITWDANGGYFLEWDDEAEEDVKTETVERQMLETRNITPGGDNPQHEDQMVFRGWGEQPDSTQPVTFTYYDEDLDRTVYNYQVAGDQTFYAIWEEPQTIAVGETKQVSSKTRFRFTAPEDGTYIFYSSENEGDPRAWLYDADGSLLEENDDAYENNNFGITAQLAAGEVVLLDAGFWSDNTGSYLLKVEHAIPVTFDGNGAAFETGINENDEPYAITSKTDYYYAGKVFTESDLDHSMNQEKMFFKGWGLTADAQEALSYDENIEGYLEVTAPITLYAIWEEGIPVTWDANGGYFWNGDEKVTSIVTYEGSGQYPNTPRPETDDTSKLYAGWSLTKDASGEGPSEVTEPVTYYAVWDNTYTLTFAAGEGSFGYWVGDGEEEESYVREKTVTFKIREGGIFWEREIGDYLEDYNIEAPKGKGRTGWELSGAEWITDEEGDYFRMTSDVTLTAMWGEYHTITWDANGGYFDDTEMTQRETQWLKPSDIGNYWYNSPGHSETTKAFVGWTDVEGGTEPIEDYREYFTEVSDLTLYAIWEEGIPVTWDANGGYFWDGDEKVTRIVTYEVTGQYPNTPRPETDDTSKLFVGWSLTKDASGEGPSEVTEPITYYAVWDNVYTLTFDAGEGSFGYWAGDGEEEEIYVREKALTFKIREGSNFWEWEIGDYLEDYHIEAPEGKGRTGWELSGAEWITDEDDGENYFCMNSDVTLTAIWGDLCTVTFVTDEGMIDEETESRVAKGTALTYVPKPVSDNNRRVFAGWATQQGSTQTLSWMEVSKGKYGYLLVDEDTTLYAVWKDAGVITWDANGGYLYTDEGQAGTLTESFAIGNVVDDRPTPGHTNERMYFVGWSLTGDESGLINDQWFEEQGAYGYFVVTGDMTLTAIWDEGYYVTFHGNGAQYGFEEWDDEEEDYTIQYRTTYTKLYRADTILSVHDGGLDEYGGEFNELPEGKMLAGWSLTENGPALAYDEAIGGLLRVDKDLDLYAVWEDDYAITIDPNGGYWWDWEMNRNSYDVRNWKSSYSADHSKISFWELRASLYNDDRRMAVTGFSTDPEGKNIVIRAGDEEPLAITDNISLYAVWEPGAVVTLGTQGYVDVNGISVLINAVQFNWKWDDQENVTYQTVPKGMPISAVPMPLVYSVEDGEWPGLAGWSLSPDKKDMICGEGADGSYVVNSDITIYPIFREEEPQQPTADEVSSQLDDLIDQAASASTDAQKESVKEAVTKLVDTVSQADNNTMIDSASAADPQLANMTRQMDDLLQSQGYGDVEIGATVPAEEKIGNGSGGTVSVNMSGASTTVANQIREDLANHVIDPESVPEGETIVYQAKVILKNVQQESSTLNLTMDISVSVVSDVPGQGETVEDHVPLASPVTVTLTLPESYQGMAFDLLHETSGGTVQVPYSSRTSADGKGVDITFAIPSCSVFRISNVHCKEHKWSVWTVTKAPTCVAAGSQTRTCSVCKKTETQAIAATGKHTPVTDAAVAATCTAAGKTAGSHCSVCGKLLTAQQAVSAKGHTPVAIAAVAATCTAAGKTDGSKCTVCGTVITAQQTVPATGHTWDVGKVTTEPTAAAAGVKTYTCTKCGATKTEAIPKLTAEEAQKKAEGDPADPKSVAGAEKAMTAVKDTGEPKGSSFSSIQLQSTKQTKNSITLKWNKVKGASGYIVYGSPCGSKYKLQRIAKQTKNSFVHTKLKKGTYYKFTVAAYKSVDGKEEVIGSSKMIHVATSGGKVTNVKKVTATVKKKAVKKLTLKAKKSATIAAKQTLQNKKLKLKKHRVIKYESSNPKIAKVTAKGKVTAKKKGKCFIYVYSQSGVFAKVTITVK